MRMTRIISCSALLLITLAALAQQSANRLPAAVVSDPRVDKQFPPSLSVLTVPSHGVEMDAFLYLASGAKPHGTVQEIAELAKTRI
jgi:hypothetical protein